MATAVPVARTVPKPTPTAAAKPAVATAAAKPAAVKGTPGRPKGAVVSGPVLSWTTPRREALIDAYRAGNTSAAEIATVLAKNPAFRGIEGRITTTKIRNQWAGLGKKMAKKGLAWPDLERSGNGEPVDLDALYTRLQGESDDGNQGPLGLDGKVDEDGDPVETGEEEEFDEE